MVASPPQGLWRERHQFLVVGIASRSVDVSRNDIVISKPSSGFSVTYRRTGRVLVALDSMRKDPKGEELMFLVRAWNAAFAKAESLGWLN
jgi:hypothetical protein